MKPRERRETGEQDLFRSRLDQIIDMRHALVKLAREVDWAFLERTAGEAYTDGSGQPPLPTRLMAGLIILKFTHNLSDEVLCERWVENPYYQHFCGEEFFQHELVRLRQHHAMPGDCAPVIDEVRMRIGPAREARALSRQT